MSHKRIHPLDLMANKTADLCILDVRGHHRHLYDGHVDCTNAMESLAAMGGLPDYPGEEAL
ncbi:MAG: hypothetical protein AAGC78_19720 [Cellvibrio sp.]|uniref:hypothetical protein n=1 Tax=Cellvibrio sp. TaxID=1965322 RepID=UPI0031A5D22B